MELFNIYTRNGVYFTFNMKSDIEPTVIKSESDLAKRRCRL